MMDSAPPRPLPQTATGTSTTTTTNPGGNYGGAGGIPSAPGSTGPSPTSTATGGSAGAVPNLYGIDATTAGEPVTGLSPPSATANYGDPTGLTGVAAVGVPGYGGPGTAPPTTIAEAIDAMMHFSRADMIWLQQQLKAAGYFDTSSTASQPIPGNADPNTIKAYISLLLDAFKSGSTAADILAQRQQGVSSQLGSPTKSIEGILKQGSSVSIDLTNPLDMNYAIDKMFQSLLERNATDAEKAGIVAQVQKMQTDQGMSKQAASNAAMQQAFDAQVASRNADLGRQAAITAGTGAAGDMGMTAGGSGAWSIFQNGGDSAAVAFATNLLQGIGAPVSAANLQFIYDWEVSEGGGGKFNPLNQGPVPGQAQLTTTGSQYGGGAADFASPDAGLQGAIAYLNMSNFTAIRDALVANNPTAAKTALINSGWAASHYNNGKNFSSKPIPAAAAPATPSPQDAGLAGLGTGAGTATGQVPTSAAATAPGLIYPFATMDPATQGKRTDQGWDMQTAAGTPVLAAGAGTISIQHDPKGFGTNYAVLTLDTPVNGVSAIYYGHASPSVAAGTRVTAGQQIATTVKAGANAGNASQDGWLEIGEWGPSGPIGNGAAMKTMLSNATDFSRGAAAPADGSQTIGDTQVGADQFIPGQAVTTTNPASADSVAYNDVTQGPLRRDYLSASSTSAYADLLGIIKNKGLSPAGAVA